MTGRKWISFVLFLTFCSCAASAQALSLFEDKIRFNGYLKTQGGLWLEDQSKYGLKGNNISMFRATLQMETQINITEWAEIYCIFRGVREPDQYDAEVGMPRGYYNEQELREFYLDVDVGENLHLRIGRQQVVWGEADYQFILDIVNPVDMGWHFMLEAWQDLRIPNYMVRAFYRLPFLDSNVELIWVPGLDKPEDRVNKLPPTPPMVGRWSPIPSDMSMDLPIPIEIRQNVQFNYPGQTLKDGNLGVRWNFTVGDFEFALMDYYTFVYNPLLVLESPLDMNDLDVGTIIDILANGLDVPVNMEYPRINMTGASMNYFWDRTGIVARVDLAYYWDYPYNVMDMTDILGTPFPSSITIQKSDTIKYMIGVDRPTMIRSLNKYGSITFTGQFVQTILLDHDDRMVVTGFTTQIDPVQTSVVFAATSLYWHGKIAPTVGGMYDFSGGWLFQPGVEYKPTNHWRINVKAALVLAHSDYDGVGMYRNKDELLMELIYMW